MSAPMRFVAVGWSGDAWDGVVAMRVMRKSPRLRARMIGAVNFFMFPPIVAARTLLIALNFTAVKRTAPTRVIEALYGILLNMELTRELGYPLKI